MAIVSDGSRDNTLVTIDATPPRRFLHVATRYLRGGSERRIRDVVRSFPVAERRIPVAGIDPRARDCSVSGGRDGLGSPIRGGRGPPGEAPRRSIRGASPDDGRTLLREEEGLPSVRSPRRPASRSLPREPR